MNRGTGYSIFECIFGENTQIYRDQDSLFSQKRILKEMKDFREKIKSRVLSGKCGLEAKKKLRV